jgi:hypothetical protein
MLASIDFFASVSLHVTPLAQEQVPYPELPAAQQLTNLEQLLWHGGASSSSWTCAVWARVVSWLVSWALTHLDVQLTDLHGQYIVVGQPGPVQQRSLATSRDGFVVNMRTLSLSQASASSGNGSTVACKQPEELAAAVGSKLAIHALGRCRELQCMWSTASLLQLLGDVSFLCQPAWLSPAYCCAICTFVMLLSWAYLLLQLQVQQLIS